MTEKDLQSRFVAKFAPEARGKAQERTDLASELAALYAHSQTIWPEVDILSGQFVEYLAERIDVARLERDRSGRHKPLCPHASDLYLCCACARGNVRAIALLDEHYLARLTRAVRGVTSSPDDIAEILQVLRVRLLVGEGDAPPKIASYRGNSALATWLRVSAVREAIALYRARKPQVPLDEQGIEVPMPRDPALAQLQGRYRNDFKAAFRAAFAGLDDRDRRILRHNIVDGLTVARIAQLYGVHRVTASRWLSNIRNTLLERTRQELLIRRRTIDDNAVDSVMRLMQSDLATGVHDMLRADLDDGE